MISITFKDKKYSAFIYREEQEHAFNLPLLTRRGILDFGEGGRRGTFGPVGPPIKVNLHIVGDVGLGFIHSFHFFQSFFVIILDRRGLNQ